MWFKISEKNINFPSLKSIYLFQSGRNSGVKIWAFDATWGISNETTPDIDFTDEAVVQCDVPDVKILL